MIPRYASFVFFVLFLFSLLIAFYTGIIDDNIQKVIFPAFSPYQLPALIIGNIPSLGKASADIIPPPHPYEYYTAWELSVNTPEYYPPLFE